MSANATTLPPKWTIKRIEEIFAPLEDGRTLHQGWSPQCEKEPSPSEDVWGVLKTTSIQAGEFQSEHNKRLPGSLEPRPQIEVKVGDLLLTCAGPRVRCGVACLVRQTRKRLMMSGKMYRFRVDPKEHDARYIEAFLQTEQARLAIDKMKTGSSDSGLNLTHERFRQLPVPVPATPDEQRRIVAEIEKQFTRLEAGVAALRRVQANLKRYRAAVLKAACEGKLVPTEAELTAKSTKSTKAKTNSVSASSALSAVKNPGYETGAELLTRILAERRKNWTGRGKYKEPAAPDTANLPPLPEGWTWASGEQLFTWSSGEGLTQKDIQPGDFPVYGGNGVTGHHNAFVAEHPTIVIGRVGALCGNVYLTQGRAWITDNAIYATQTPSDISMKFVEIVFDQAGLNKRAAGSGQPFVNQRMLNETIVPLPPQAEQTRIVAEVERRLSVVEELESVVSANLQRATRLRQSILQKAFTGELS